MQDSFNDVSELSPKYDRVKHDRHHVEPTSFDGSSIPSGGSGGGHNSEVTTFDKVDKADAVRVGLPSDALRETPSTSRSFGSNTEGRYCERNQCGRRYMTPYGGHVRCLNEDCSKAVVQCSIM